MHSQRGAYTHWTLTKHCVLVCSQIVSRFWQKLVWTTIVSHNWRQTDRHLASEWSHGGGMDALSKGSMHSFEFDQMLHACLLADCLQILTKVSLSLAWSPTVGRKLAATCLLSAHMAAKWILSQRRTWTHSSLSNYCVLVCQHIVSKFSWRLVWTLLHLGKLSANCHTLLLSNRILAKWMQI